MKGFKMLNTRMLIGVLVAVCFLCFYFIQYNSKVSAKVESSRDTQGTLVIQTDIEQLKYAYIKKYTTFEGVKTTTGYELEDGSIYLSTNGLLHIIINDKESIYKNFSIREIDCEE